jgi:hypothetical protein
MAIWAEAPLDLSFPRLSFQESFFRNHGDIMGYSRARFCGPYPATHAREVSHYRNDAMGKRCPELKRPLPVAVIFAYGGLDRGAADLSFPRLSFQESIFATMATSVAECIPREAATVFA